MQIDTATNPGDKLKDLFNRYAPCLILIDEWVAYARQLHYEKDLPAGDFDTHFTFAQTLSESAARLTLEILNDYVWKNANHIDLKTLWKYLTNYLYLPRLKDEQVLSDAIAEGVANLLWNENFAYANGYDETKQKYLGLEVGKHITPIMSSSSLLVKPDVAQQQIQKEVVPPPPIINPDRNGSKDDDDEDKDKEEVTPPPPPQLKQKRRFYGSVELDSERINRDASAIADEVLQHLTSSIGSKVKVTLEIEAKVTEGIPDNVIRTVSENCKTLKFTSQGFEEE